MKFVFNCLVIIFCLVLLIACQEQPITVTYQVNGGVLPNDFENVQIITNHSIDKLPLPTKEGFDFLGWFLNLEEEAEEFNSNILLSDSITLYAHWKIAEFEVIFQDDDDFIYNRHNVTYGSVLSFPNDPERNGYTFLGWDHEDSIVTEDLVVTAIFSINHYMVTFLDYDDSVIHTQTVAFGTSAVAPQLEEREGYEFVGWNQDYTNVLTDLIVTACYEIAPVRDETGTIIPNNLKYHTTNLLDVVQKGDIIFEATSLNGIGHIAIIEGIYYSSDFNTSYIRVIEALGNGVCRNIYDENRLMYGQGSIWRIKQVTNEQIENAIQFCIEQLGKPYLYDGFFGGKDYNPSEVDWYCSELVWASYYNQGINLEMDGGGRIGGILPRDIIEDNDLYQVRIIQ